MLFLKQIWWSLVAFLLLVRSSCVLFPKSAVPRKRTTPIKYSSSAESSRHSCGPMDVAVTQWSLPSRFNSWSRSACEYLECGSTQFSESQCHTSPLSFGFIQNVVESAQTDTIKPEVHDQQWETFQKRCLIWLTNDEKNAFNILYEEGFETDDVVCDTLSYEASSSMDSWSWSTLEPVCLRAVSSY